MVLKQAALIKKSGKAASSNELKKVILEIINSEDKKSPLTDSDIVEKLNDRDFLVARRTVAKYREQMQIPVARLRKQLV